MNQKAQVRHATCCRLSSTPGSRGGLYRSGATLPSAHLSSLTPHLVGTHARLAFAAGVVHERYAPPGWHSLVHQGGLRSISPARSPAQLARHVRSVGGGRYQGSGSTTTCWRPRI